MMSRTMLAALLAVIASACSRSEPAPKPQPPGQPPPASAAPAPVAAKVDCGTLTGANAVQTEMRQLECTLQLVVAAIGRNDLATIPPAIETLHKAKQATEGALHAGAYKPANGDVAAFVALDEAFHRSLVTLYESATANDHAGASAAMGTILGACQGCHATFRPTAPPGAAAPSAQVPADAPAGHAH